VRGVKLKKKYNVKKTISMKMFISEFGEAFTSHTKLKLLEIGKRCVLSRKEIDYCFDIKHVEHIKHECSNIDNPSEIKFKEYTFGQLLVSEEFLYFSTEFIEGADTIQYPTISNIYNAMEAPEECIDGNINAKRLQDSNVNYVIDKLLEICPPLSAEYMKIIGRYK
jgi:hypothetical protein